MKTKLQVMHLAFSSTNWLILFYATIFTCWDSSTWCTATRPSMEPSRYPVLSGKHEMQRVWYFKGESNSLKTCCGFVKLKICMLFNCQSGVDRSLRDDFNMVMACHKSDCQSLTGKFLQCPLVGVFHVLSFEYCPSFSPDHYSIQICYVKYLFWCKWCSDFAVHGESGILEPCAQPFLQPSGGIWCPLRRLFLAWAGCALDLAVLNPSTSQSCPSYQWQAYCSFPWYGRRRQLEHHAWPLLVSDLWRAPTCWLVYHIHLYTRKNRLSVTLWQAISCWQHAIPPFFMQKKLLGKSLACRGSVALTPSPIAMANWSL